MSTFTNKKSSKIKDQIQLLLAGANLWYDRTVSTPASAKTLQRKKRKEKKLF